MRYAIVWRPEAEDQLATLWLRTSDKNAVTRCIDLVDQSLERDPHERGESRDAGTRLAFFPPLWVRYQIDDGARAVTVVAVKWVGP